MRKGHGIKPSDRNYAGKPCLLCSIRFKPVHPRQLRCQECMTACCVDCGVVIRGASLRRLLSNRVRRCAICNTNSFSGRHIRADGYVLIHVVTRKWKLEHRLVMEKKLGRSLRPGEIVHHLDENPSNNHPDNLVLCKSLREHLDTYHAHALVPPPIHHNGRRPKSAQRQAAAEAMETGRG